MNNNQITPESAKKLERLADIAPMSITHHPTRPLWQIYITLPLGITAKKGEYQDASINAKSTDINEAINNAYKTVQKTIAKTQNTLKNLEAKLP